MDPAQFLQERGMGIDTSTLPYPAPVVPSYEEGTFGKWSLERMDVPMARGYFRGLQPVLANYVLRERKSDADVTWMSLTPMELESHMPHIRAAHGHVLVAGMGMGMYVRNILCKESVLSVTVIEKDASILRAVRRLSDMSRWDGIEKLHTVEFDALDPRVGGALPRTFDYLYADIWSVLGAEEARADVKSMAEACTVLSHSWWGMELDYVEWLTVGLAPGCKVTEEDADRRVSEWVEAALSYGINPAPVALQEGWGSLALRAAHNVTLY